MLLENYSGAREVICKRLANPMQRPRTARVWRALGERSLISAGRGAAILARGARKARGGRRSDPARVRKRRCPWPAAEPGPLAFWAISGAFWAARAEPEPASARARTVALDGGAAVPGGDERNVVAVEGQPQPRHRQVQTARVSNRRPALSRRSRKRPAVVGSTLASWESRNP